MFVTPTMAPITTFLVEYGHLLIGLSLLTGLMVRVSASFGVLLMLIYWMAHMDWPFIENTNNFIVDYHLVYAGVLVYLIVKRAGHVWGLDGWAENLGFVRQHPDLKPLFAWRHAKSHSGTLRQRGTPVVTAPLGRIRVAIPFRQFPKHRMESL
jgi:thiosulfate dehydrogenase (quinone) large subunit